MHAFLIDLPIAVGKRYILKGAVMQIEKALINDRLSVSKVS